MLDEDFSNARLEMARTRIALDDDEDIEDWGVELVHAENAVRMLLARKIETLKADPAMEHVLWRRHRERLRALKKMTDAIAL